MHRICLPKPRCTKLQLQLCLIIGQDYTWARTSAALGPTGAGTFLASICTAASPKLSAACRRGIISRPVTSYLVWKALLIGPALLIPSFPLQRWDLLTSIGSAQSAAASVL